MNKVVKILVLSKNVPQPKNTDLSNYSIEDTPTKASAWGALLYISNKLSYKPRTDLKIYTPGKLESFSYKSFVQIPQIWLLVAGEFNSNCISPLLDKLSKECSKQIFLLGKLKYESFELVYSFFDTLSSNFLSPQIILPIRISSFSTTR